MVLCGRSSARPIPRGARPPTARPSVAAGCWMPGLSILGSASGSRGADRAGPLPARQCLGPLLLRELHGQRRIRRRGVRLGDRRLAATTQAAVAARPADEQARAAMANIVRSIAGDPRVGRLLFSTELADPVVVRKRDESAALLAMLLGQHVGEALRLPEDDGSRPRRTSSSAAWGRRSARGSPAQVRLTPGRTVDQLAWFDRPAQPPVAAKPARVPGGRPPSSARC